MAKKTTIEELEQRVKELESEAAKTKQINKDLQQEAGFLLAILNNTNLPVYLKDSDYRYIFINRQYESLAHVTNKEINGKKDHDIFPKPIADLFRSQDKEVKKRKAVVEFTETIPLADGEHTFITSKFPLKGTDGHIFAIGGVCTDITDLKRTAEALSESEEKYKNLFNYSSDGIFVHDLKGNIVDVNKMVLDQSGYTRDEILKLKVMDLHPPEMLEKAKHAFQKISITGYVNFEISFKKKNGETFPAEVSSSLIEIDGQKIIQGVVRDITDRKKLEEEFQKIQKLESTGVLAGGIAHDFNNILTAILGNISMAKIFAESNEKVLKKLIEAEKASMRAQDLSQRLLTFSKGGDPIKKPTKITELLKDSASFSLTGSNVKCSLFMVDKLWPVNIDEGQISQVVQNVVKNADQAMPDGGTVIIQAENKTISGKDPLPLKEGKYVWITIKDQGGGIPGKYIAKIFDPYFSTKQEGSGLGLAAAFSIVNKHGGLISAESESGEGTTFHIYLPASEKVSPVKKRAKEKLLHSGEKILIMDDDLAVLKIASQMLNMMGFKAETATNGQEAVALYKKAQKDGRPFGAALLDLTIPGGMGGKETVKQLFHIDPEVKAIVTSGYANDPIMADYESFGFSSVLSKPYDIEKLGEALRVLFG